MRHEPPNKGNAARTRGGAVIPSKSVNAPYLARQAPDANQICADLDAARQRIDRATDLLQRSFDLREQLYFGLELDDLRAEVASFKRECRAWHSCAEAAS